MDSSHGWLIPLFDIIAARRHEDFGVLRNFPDPASCLPGLPGLTIIARILNIFNLRSRATLEFDFVIRHSGMPKLVALVGPPCRMSPRVLPKRTGPSKVRRVRTAREMGFKGTDTLIYTCMIRRYSVPCARCEASGARACARSALERVARDHASE